MQGCFCLGPRANQIYISRQMYNYTLYTTTLITDPNEIFCVKTINFEFEVETKNLYSL